MRPSTRLSPVPALLVLLLLAATAHAADPFPTPPPVPPVRVADKTTADGREYKLGVRKGEWTWVRKPGGERPGNPWRWTDEDGGYWWRWDRSATAATANTARGSCSTACTCGCNETGVCGCGKAGTAVGANPWDVAGRYTPHYQIAPPWQTTQQNYTARPYTTQPAYFPGQGYGGSAECADGSCSGGR